MRNTPAETKERDTGWRLSKLGVVVVQWVAVVVVNPPKPRDWAKTLLFIKLPFNMNVVHCTCTQVNVSHFSLWIFLSVCTLYIVYAFTQVYVHLMGWNTSTQLILSVCALNIVEVLSSTPHKPRLWVLKKDICKNCHMEKADQHHTSTNIGGY